MEFDAWTCPSCGRRFARPNTRHVCERYSVSERLASFTPESLALYAALRDFAAGCGEFFEEATKTAIEFKTPRTFIAVGVHRKWINCTIWLPHPVHHRRILHNYPVTNTLYAVQLRISRIEELDDELKAWLCEAYFYLESDG